PTKSMLPTTNSVRSGSSASAFSTRALEASRLGATFWCLVAGSAFEAVPRMSARARGIVVNMVWSPARSPHLRWCALALWRHGWEVGVRVLTFDFYLRADETGTPSVSICTYGPV